MQYVFFSSRIPVFEILESRSTSNATDAAADAIITTNTDLFAIILCWLNKL